MTDTIVYKKEDDTLYNLDFDELQRAAAKEGGSSSLLFELLGHLSKGMDVVKIQAPMFMMKPVSFIEMVADFCYPYDFALNANKEDTAEKRMVAITKQILAVAMLAPVKSFNMMKPYNPILGEVFQCRWEHETSTTIFTGEQVSHHPPITAIYMENRKMNYIYTGSILLGGKFYGNSADQTLAGEHIIHLLEVNEKYVFQMPSIIARGIVFGKGRLEAYGDVSVKCEQTKYSAFISFQADNVSTGEIKDPNGKVIYKFNGYQDDKVNITDVREKKKESLFLEYSVLSKRTRKSMKPLSEQKECESRRVWHPVTKEIIAKNLDAAEKEKTIIENRQRKKAKESTDPYVPVYFTKINKIVNDAPVFHFKEENFTPYVEEKNDDVTLDLD
jgi:hypothetical protein